MELLVVTLGLLFSFAFAQPSYGGCNIFPTNMNWNVKVDGLGIHPSNSQFASVLGTKNLHLDLGTTMDQQSTEYYGIPWNQADASVSWVPITFDAGGGYHDESDCATGPAHPYTIHSPCGAGAASTIPANIKLPIPTLAQVESGIAAAADGPDHHLLIVDTVNCSLWEVYQTYKNANGWYTPGGISRWDLRSGALRPKGWTSSDAAGLPVMPLLLKADEATAIGSIKHAFRFTLSSSQIRSPNTAYEWPARHNTGKGDASTPLMGQRFRLKASFVIPTTWSVQAQSIATALKEYGIILADIGSSMYIQGIPHAGWSDTMLREIQSITADKFEAVDVSSWKARPGWNENSGLVPPEVDPCAGNTCSGHGVCSAGVCGCTGGWTGPDCSVVSDCLADAGWPNTKPGATAVKACGAGQTGNNTRVCSAQGVWGIQVNTCVSPATCTDKIKNQDETAVDCGGTVCPACAQCPNINCGANGKCVEANPPSCTCSGGFSGDRCQTPPDPCLSINCGAHGACNTQTGLCVCTGNFTGNLCQFPPQATCVDGIKNQDETAVDCGGICPACTAYTWEALDWQPCSVSCNAGKQIRVVRCTTSPGVVVDNNLCDNEHPTASEQVCNPDPCPSYKWQAGPFELCSVPCGGGVETRQVDCISSLGNVVVLPGPSTCPLSAKPISTQPCNPQACTANHWNSGMWTQCSRDCGGGVQSRTVMCFDADNANSLQDDKCTALKPPTEQACNLQECASYHWEACKNWSPCSATCGGGDGMLGQQWRDVYCMDGRGNFVDSTLCANGTKPFALVNICNTHKCLTYNWMVTSPGWGPCVNGVRNRTFHCHSADGRNSIYQNCVLYAGPMPLASIPCAPGTCLVAGCPDGEVYKLFAACEVVDMNLMPLDIDTPTACSAKCSAAYSALLAAFPRPQFNDDTQQLCIESFLGVPNFGVSVEAVSQLARKGLFCAAATSNAVIPLSWVAAATSLFGTLFF